MSAALKGWRWIGEMDEIAASMAGAGLPTGFHGAAADVYDRTAHVTPSQPASSSANGGRPGAGRSGARSGSAGAGTLDAVLSALLAP
jgi:hypothetical protein